MIIGILGILKAGGCYVPLDPDYPVERLRYILHHATIEILLTEHQVSEQLISCVTEPLPLQTVLFLDEGERLNKINDLTQITTSIWQKHSKESINLCNRPEDLMVILYTSGSTGRPKGVMLNHRGYMNRLEWMQKTFSLKTGDRIAQRTSFCFDISVWEIFWTLMEGATICPVKREVVLNPWEFAAWIKKTKINVMHFVPSLFGEFISAIENESWTFPDLRWLIFSGEALPMSFIQKWLDCYGLKTGLANLYGPTEASIDVTYHIITERPDERTSSQIPIGKAIDNVYLKVLDDQMQPVKQGEMGELWLGGVQLALGYLKDPEKTAKAFCSNPFSDVSGDYIYPESSNLVLKNISLAIHRGEFLGIIGPTGAGKTTLCLTLNGIVPQFYGGRFFGYATVAGLDTLTHPVSTLARYVGAVFEANTSIKANFVEIQLGWGAPKVNA